MVGRAAGLAMAVALGTAGCASKAPPYSRPALPVPVTYAEAVPADGAAAAAIPWRAYFTEPRLQSLIDAALANNRDLRLAVLRVDEARAAYRIQRSDGKPLVAVSATGAAAHVPDLGLSGEAIDAQVLAVNGGVTSWEIDFWGRVRSLEDAALASYLATDAGRRAAALSVIAQVASGYLALRELDERLVLARRTVALRQESLRIFRRRVELGATARLELTQVELLWQQAIALVSQLELERATRAHALALLVGTSADLSPEAAPLDDAAMFQPIQPGLPSELLTNRPDIVAAEHALQSANANIGAARAAFFPRISLTGLLGLISADLGALFGGTGATWVFAPSIAQPIFDGGRRDAALDLAEVRHSQAVVRYEQAIQAAFRDVSDALSARQWLGEQVRTLRATYALQQERARLARLRYDSGAARYLEVLDAERELLAVEQQLVQVRRALLATHVALYAALGGGTQQPDPSPAADQGPARPEG